VKVIRAKAREHLPSYREPAGRNPHVEQAFTFSVSASPRTVLPFLGSCPASGGASSFPPASVPALHKTLRSSGGQDTRCVRPTSATSTIYVHPYLVRSRLAPQLSSRGHPRSLGLRAVDRGTECFTTLVNASADRSGHALPCLESSCRTFRRGGSERGRCLPTVPATDRASDTSVASPSSARPGAPSRLLRSFGSASRIALPREAAAKVAVTTFS
jgi:hypothetical protein